MSFQNNCIWMPSGSGSVTYGETDCDTSAGIEHKRSYQWLMDTSEQDLFLNKKQTIESVKETSGVAAVTNDSFRRDSSSSQSGGQLGNFLSSLKPILSSNVSDKNVPCIVYTYTNAENKGIEDQIRNDSSIYLSMSQIEDPPCLNTEFENIKASEVKMSENCFAEFLGSSFYPAGNDKVTSKTYPGSIYSTLDGNSISTYIGLSDRNFISVGPSSSKRDDNLMLTNQCYDEINNNMLSIGQSFNRVNYYVNPIGEKYEKENDTITSNGPIYGKGRENLYAVDPFSSKVNQIFMSGSSSKKQDATVASLRTLYNNECSSIPSMGQNCKRGEQTTICFGGFQDNNEESDSSGRLISNYDVLLNHSSKDVVRQLSPNVVSATTSKTDGTHKKNEQKISKKASSNNFPSNVKSLLSTGILDGVPVKYVSWSREKNLRGVIKGTGYLCGCEECKLSKVINAYEFERHANCKTKHPNNHIYFENGKTIYAVVQELKSTPQETLFEVIQNVTGTAVNQKKFDAWKASYQAATRELQRIYGMEELIVPS